MKGKTPAEVRQNLRNFMRMSTEFQAAGLYYTWGLNYNKDLEFDDLMNEFNNLNGEKNNG